MKTRLFLLGTLLSVLASVTVFGQLPPAPFNLTASFEQPSPNSFGSVKLEWQMPTAGQWVFMVSRSAHDTTSYQQIAAGVRTLMFRDFNIVRGTRYFYYVRAASLNFPTVVGPRSNVAEILVPPLGTTIHGFINGTVTDDSTNLPIRNARIRFFRLANTVTTPPAFVFTDSLGHYHATLDTGRYIIRAEVCCATNTGCYYPEYFDNVREPSQATIVPVGDSTTFTADFGLTRVSPPRYATLSGTVRDTLNNPIARARVAVLRTMQNMISVAANGGLPGEEESMTLDGVGFTMGVQWCGLTDSLGRYTARLITGRDYIVMASKPGYWPEYYDNKPTPQLADIIHFTQDTSGIDFSLSVRQLAQNSVAGRVVDSLGNGVPSRVYLHPVRFPQPSITPVRYGHTDSLGNFLINNVGTGKYFVSAYPFIGFAPAYYKANACGVDRRDQADTVEVSGNVTNINICVRQIRGNGLARISGIVRTNTNATLRGATITAETENGILVGIGISEPSGYYVIEAVPSGSITLTADRDGYNLATTTVLLPPAVLSLDNVNITLSPGGVTSAGSESENPRTFALEQNYPNPFNPGTEIRYQTSEAGLVTLKVFDVLGREAATLVNEVKPAGRYSTQFDASNLASGVYYYQLRAGDFVATKKMVLIR